MRKSIAMFIIVLMISLPIYSSLAFAQINVDNVHVRGADNIDDVIKEIDYIDVEAAVSIEGDIDVSAEQVWYQSGRIFESFNECAESDAGIFTCAFKHPETGKTSWVSKQHDFKIYVYTDEKPKPMAAEHTYEGNYEVDGKEPKVTDFDIIEAITKEPKVTVEFAVEDTSYRGSRKCSGIDKVEIYDKSDISAPVETFTNENEGCGWFSEEEVDLTGKEGEITLCARPYDNFGQNPENLDKCDKVIVDSQGADISDSWSLISNNLPVTHFKDSSIRATFSINISGSDLVEDSVVGVFSEINEDKAEEYREVRADSCDLIANTVINNCKWNNLEVKLSPANAGTKTVTITAADQAGNPSSRNINIRLDFDDTGPAVVSLTTGSEADGKLFARSSGNVFTAEINEQGVGLNKDDVILHVDRRTYKATSCEKPSNWICAWERIGISGNRVVKASIGADSKDRLGNAFVFGDEGKLEREVIVDNTRTVVNDIKIEQGPPINNVAVIPGRIKTGDAINIIANLTEPNGIRSAIGNFAVINEGNTAVEAAPCPDVGGHRICAWSGIQITKPGYINKYLEFTFTDNAGNIIEVKNHPKARIEVFESETGAPPDFYTLNIDENYIQEIDKEILGGLLKQYYREVVPIQLKYNGGCAGNIEVLSVRVEGQGQNCNNERILPSYSPDPNNNYNGVLVFLIGKEHAQAGFSEIEIGGTEPCALRFNVRCVNKVFTTPESEPIAIKIPLRSDIEEKSATEKVAEKIDKETEKAKSGWSVVDKLDKFVNYLGSMCRVKQTFGSILSAYAVIGLIWGGCSDLPLLGQLCKPGEQGMTSIYAVTEEASKKLANKFLDGACGIVQCSGSTVQNKALKWASGGYCDMFKQWTYDTLRVPKYAMLNQYVDPEKPGTATHEQRMVTAAKRGFADAFYQQSTLDLAKKSLYFSVGCGCLPGIIYNIKKWRQMDCWYGFCLKYLVPTGFPLEDCEKQREYDQCVYLHGQWTVFIDIIAAPLNAIISIMEHPVASAFEVTKIVAGNKCKIPCPSGTCEMKWSFSCIVNAGMVLTESFAEMAHILTTKGYFKPYTETDWCEKLKEDITPGGENE